MCNRELCRRQKAPAEAFRRQKKPERNRRFESRLEKQLGNASATHTCIGLRVRQFLSLYQNLYKRLADMISVIT